MPRGRPKGNGNVLNKKLSFRASEELIKSILHYSKEKNIDTSDAIRELISIGVYQYFIENAS